VRVGAVQKRQIAPLQQFGGDGLGGFIVGLLEVVEHFFEGVFEHVLQVLVEINARVRIQMVVSAGWGIGVEAIAKREGVWVADGIIGVAIGLRDRRSGGAVLSWRNCLFTSILGRNMLVRILDNRCSCVFLNVIG
jgi:hypothetical protein